MFDSKSFQRRQNFSVDVMTIKVYCVIYTAWNPRKIGSLYIVPYWLCTSLSLHSFGYVLSLSVAPPNVRLVNFKGRILCAERLHLNPSVTLKAKKFFSI
jgi:hypothetical protein